MTRKKGEVMEETKPVQRVDALCDEYIEKIFLTELDAAEPKFIGSGVIEGLLSKPWKVTPQTARGLYSFVKLCQQDNKMELPICEKVIRVLKDYERRRVTR